MSWDVLVEADPTAAWCPTCDADLREHRIRVGGVVLLCRLCMHELATAVPAPRRRTTVSSSSPDVEPRRAGTPQPGR